MRALAAGFGLVVSGLCTLPASAQAIEFGRPNYDLVEVTTSTFFPAAPQGTANEGTCTVFNTSSGPVRVRLSVDIVYADGSVGRLSQIQDPGVLDVDGGFELSIFFVIPPDAPLGPAQFVCSIRAQSLLSRREQEGEISAAPFEIVP